MKREPSYCHHKGSDQAYVRLHGYLRLRGKVFYLGKYGSEESQELYKRLKSEWLLNKNSSKFSSLSSGPTIAELAIAYLDHAEVYYGIGTELANLKLARKAKIEPWSANQLRHTRATEIRSLFGLEAAASILGRSEIGVTQVYAEADMQRAIEVAQKTG